tara:strand:+ start:1439 stop:1714 length:276 start_codon:yes stop_codon:yes gene_type:complete
VLTLPHLERREKKTSLFAEGVTIVSGIAEEYNKCTTYFGNSRKKPLKAGRHRAKLRNGNSSAIEEERPRNLRDECGLRRRGGGGGEVRWAG